MSLPIHVTPYSAYKANERPLEFVLDDEIYEIAAVLDQWYEMTPRGANVTADPSDRFTEPEGGQLCSGSVALGSPKAGFSVWKARSCAARIRAWRTGKFLKP